MTDLEKIAFKARLKQAGLSLIGDRITSAKQAIDDAQQAANQEEKSSAGDKYETSRAMGHLQKDMFARQMAEQQKEKTALHAVNVERVYAQPGPGAFIQCGHTGFFIAAGLGKQRIDDQVIFFLSPAAPLARSLENKRPGDDFVFNGTKSFIQEIF